MDIETIERCQLGSETVARQSSEPAVCDRVFVEIESISPEMPWVGAA